MKKGRLVQTICICIIIPALLIFFIVMGWWIALIAEVVLVVAAIIGAALFLVDSILKRKSPQWEDDVDVLGKHGHLNDFVKDAVTWLETGELWEQTSEDGLKLRGRFHKKEGSHTYALCCHGYKNQRMQDISNQVKHFYDKGHNVFAGHARGHGKSEGGYVGMACRERRDIVGWIKMIVERDPEARIFLYGVSMGGATVMTTSGEELPENVRCFVEDCGYSSIWDEFCFHMRYVYGLPARPILNVCQLIVKSRYGYGFSEHSAKRQVKQAKMPFLFLHGDQDTFVPYFMMKPVYEACSSVHKKAVTIEGAEHAESYWKGGEYYWKEVDGWVEQYL